MGKKKKKQVSAHRSREETPKHRTKENNHNSTDSHKKARSPFKRGTIVPNLLWQPIIAFDFGLWVLDFRVRALGFGFQILGFGIQPFSSASMLWTLAPGSMLSSVGTGLWTLFTGLQALGCGLWALFTGLRVLDSRFWILGSGLFTGLWLLSAATDDPLA